MSANDPAFPWPHTGHSGLTKRELFAAMAMQGLLSSGGTIDHKTPEPTLVAYTAT